MTKRFVIAIILLVIVVGGIVGWNLFRDMMIAQFLANRPVPTVPVSTAEAQPVSWTPGIQAIGTVSAARGVDLTVETTGIVQEIRFAANQKVAAGDVLVQLDDAVPRADLEVARTQAALDEQTLRRTTQLQERGVTTAVSVENARAALQTSTSQVGKLAAVVDQKQVRAPFSGTIGIPKIEKGQYLAPGTIVATLQDLETMRVDFQIPEQELPKLKQGLEVALGLGGEERPFRGRIIGIDPKVEPSTRLVAVRAEIADPQGRLTPGQFVEVRVELPAEDGVLAIPQTSLTASLYGDYVFVVREAEDSADASAESSEGGAGEAPPAPKLTATQVFVTTGRRDRGMVEITRGISAGDVVVTAGQNRLTSGSPVEIDNSIRPDSGVNRAAAGQ